MSFVSDMDDNLIKDIKNLKSLSPQNLNKYLNNNLAKLELNQLINNDVYKEDLKIENKEILKQNIE